MLLGDSHAPELAARVSAHGDKVAAVIVAEMTERDDANRRLQDRSIERMCSHGQPLRRRVHIFAPRIAALEP